MPCCELAHLELLAEVDALVDRLNRWADHAPAWQPAEKCRALVRRLTERAVALRVRIEAPLVVATLGGTGTGKSALINAIVGVEVVQTGRSRPTTTRPTLVCRPGLTPEMLGIDPASVELVNRDLPALRDLVLVDCPDPDTTEEHTAPAALPPTSCSGRACPPCVGENAAGEPARYTGVPTPAVGSNLARLRAILPKCDVLLVTATQQKYRSARVADELAASARGAHLVFVQTHADIEDDIRDDWRQVLAGEKLSGNLPSPFGRGAGGEGGVEAGSVEADTPSQNALTLTLSQRERGPIAPLSQRERGPIAPLSQRERGHIFRIDSLRALADAQNGLQPRGEFAELLDLLTRQMAGAAGNRIRRANFLDLAADTLGACRTRIDEALPSVQQVQIAIDQERGLLAAQVAGEMQAELLANRRQWENRLLGQTASRWGLSPFSLVLRVYQGIGGLLSGALLYRARTPAQMALWGALEGMRTWRKRRQTRQADRGVTRGSIGGFDPAELRKAAIIIDGYVAEAGLRGNGWGRHSCLPEASKNTCPTFFAEVAAEAETAAAGFVARVAGELESLVARLAQRHTGWFIRFRYEILLIVMLGLLLYRLGKNFFYDSWLAEQPAPVYGLESYLVTLFWLVLWCMLLLWAFCRRLRRGLRAEIDHLAVGWQTASSAVGIFARLEADCRRVEQFRQELEAIRRDVEGLQRQVAGSHVGQAVPDTGRVSGTA